MRILPNGSLLFTLLFFLITPASGFGQEGTDCSSCHDQGAKLPQSAHAKVTCLECHPKFTAYPHPENVPKPQCASCHPQQAGEHSRSVHGLALEAGNAAAPGCATCHGDTHELPRAGTPEFHRLVPETCGMCHTEVAEQFNASVHGQAVARGIREAPVCTDCHGEHEIRPHTDTRSTVNPLQIRETCGSCHDDVRLGRRFNIPLDRIQSFDESFHGLALKAGSQTVANCASCHGVHNIFRSTDRRATTNVANLPQTCGQCHPGAGSRFAIGTVHLAEGFEPAVVVWVRRFYLGVIPFTLGFMILHHLGDWIRKLFRMRIQAQAGASAPLPLRHAEVRMLRFERIQHFLLLTSFMVLVWSGFALKYPDAWWAVPLVAYESAYPFRGTIHRIAAAVLVTVSIMHVLSLLVNRRLRSHWLTMLPRRNDVYEMLGALAYNLGLRSTKPVISPHSYVEKVEYWAVVWGTFIMAATGFLLWFNNWSLRWMPKSWLDAATSIHFYEAVLASLAILIWHFYTVIFDPDVYPMDPAWLTGHSVRRRVSHSQDEPAVEAHSSEERQSSAD
ncbi:MAG: hypothetical protein HUU41_04015 [Bryobacteraceae bacterium]|nr:hypothetical protein [Bryobacterales bacterium]MEB2361817.1 hypothetical protein [Bryobacterales bacterium]NUN00256.1 hypothetical protein [Bryobacteraceae bacterium]